MKSELAWRLKAELLDSEIFFRTFSAGFGCDEGGKLLDLYLQLFFAKNAHKNMNLKKYIRYHSMWKNYPIQLTEDRDNA